MSILYEKYTGKMDTFHRAHDIEKYPPGLNPIDLFLDADIETRSEVLLNHPDVTGFVYIHDDEITKAFFPTKVIDFKAKDATKIFYKRIKILWAQ